MFLAKPRWKYAALLSVSALLGLLIGWSPVGAQIDAWAYDFFLRLREPPPATSLILAIDEETLDKYGGLLNLRRPVAQALQTLAPWEPAAVAVDIVLSEPGNEPDNVLLERAIAGTPNVVLAAHLTSNSTPLGGAWQEPLERFSDAAEAIGHVHAEPDNDGVCRRLLLAKAAGARRHWAMALEAYRLAQGGGPIVETESGLELRNGRVIPLPHQQERSLRISYASPQNPVPRLSLQDVLEHPETASAVQGRVVFVGVVVPGGPDQYLMTPSSFGQAMSGVEINANAYETLARGDFLLDVSDSGVLLLALTMAAALGGAFAGLSGRKAVWTAVALLLAAHLLPLAFFAAHRILAPAPLTLTAWACFLTGGAYHYLAVRGQLRTAESQRDRYQKAVHYVTHEMRTPLTTIQGSSELISRYALPEEKRKEIARLIHKESQRLARLVEMFLSVEKLSAGQLELRREAIRPREILQECIGRARPLAARKQISITHQPDTEQPIWGDREFLEYACYNLLTNAIKYSPAHSAITVRAWHDEDTVRLSVEDRGYGMDETELRRIFKRFYRTRQAELSGETGSGLGLAIVEEIVVQHSGSIQVESLLNEGSRFTLSLPRFTGQAVPAAS